MIKDFYIEKESSLHRLNFWTKFLCLLLLLPLSGFLAPKILLPVLFVILIVLLLLSKIRLQKFWSLTKLYHIPITIGVIVLALFFSKGSLTARFLEGAILAVRFIILISFGSFFAMITNPIEIPAGLLKVKIPHRYGITLMVAFRMLPLLSQKVKSILDAQRTRGADLRFSLKNLPKLPVVFMSLMIPILHSTLETSVKLSDTLISRGYNPQSKISVPPMGFNKTDYVLVLFSIIILISTSLI